MSNMKITGIFFGFLSLLPGLLIFSFYFDFSIINPSNITWIIQSGGDQMQHYLGSLAFRADEWHFPITKTTAICYPEGASIIYTDSNPLLSIIAKLFKSIFLPDQQFVGFWYLLCFILQSFLTYLVLFQQTNNRFYSILCSSILCMLPTQIFRISHENLMAFWLIILIIYILLSPTTTTKQKLTISYVTLILSLLIHAYISIMLIIMLGIYIVSIIYEKNKENKPWVSSTIIYSTLSTIGLLLTMWTLGYFYNKSVDEGLMGFGYFSMNLLAIYNPIYSSFSTILPSIPIKEGQYEGFQYIGFGNLSLWIIILLLFFYTTKSFTHKKILYLHLGILTIIIIIQLFLKVPIYQIGLFLLFYLFIYVTSKGIVSFNEKFKPLIWASIFCLFIALSNEIVIGEFRFLKIQLSEKTFFSSIFALIRSSGRFFWVSIHVFLLSNLILLYKYLSNKKFAYLLISTIIILQLIDISQLKDRINSNGDNTQETKIPEDQKDLILKSNIVNFLSNPDLDIIKLCLENRIPVNDFYMTHNPGKLTTAKKEKQRQDFFKNQTDSNSIFFYKIKDIPENKYVTIGSISYHNYIVNKTKTQSTNDSTKWYVKLNKTDSLKFITNKIKSGELVILAVKDEGYRNLPISFISQMDSLFGTKLSTFEFRNSYIAIFEKGQLLHESIDKNNLINYSRRWNNLEITIQSGGAHTGNISKTSIKDIDYSINERGFNMVSVKKTDHDYYVNIANFDTHEKKYSF